MDKGCMSVVIPKEKRKRKKEENEADNKISNHKERHKEAPLTKFLIVRV